MDYTSIPRSLFYKEKKDLSIFTRNRSKDSLEYQYLKRLKKLQFYKHSIEAPEFTKEILNNACYICSLIYYEEQPAMYSARYVDKSADRRDGEFPRKFISTSTMALVYNWLGSDWFRSKKCLIDGGDESDVLDEIDIIRENIYEQFSNVKPFTNEEWIANIFLTLVLETNNYSPNIIEDDIICRSLDEVLEDPDIPLNDVAMGIDYIIDWAKDKEDEEYEHSILSKIMTGFKKELEEREKGYISTIIEGACDKVESRLREIGRMPEEGTVIEDQLVEELKNEINKEKQIIDLLQNECEEWKKKYQEAIETNTKKEPEIAFNAQTQNQCFTSKQMGILMHAIALTGENPPPGKTTIGEVVERISGYKAASVNQNMKGAFRDTDKKIVAAAIESKFPNLAAKVRKL
ncbi:MAG: hypothetical protein K6A94_13285 [Bacteroidales bacterium]|nr:hypothetical protein [Bacteroidales bacterium]